MTTEQHKATPDDWAQQEDWAYRRVFSDSSCILELRDRVEALEAAPLVNYAPVKPEYRDKLDRLIEQDRSNPQQLALVERVADAIAAQATSAGIVNDRPARAALRVVADAALQMHPDKNLTWERVALWLEQEANRG
jgi:hypothetical protein